MLLCLCLTSHQQLRSYSDGATAESLIRQTGEAGNRTCDPWFTRQAVYPLHHSSSYCATDYNHLEFVSLTLTGGYTGLSESTLVKMPHCWKSHVAAHMQFTVQIH